MPRRIAPTRVAALVAVAALAAAAPAHEVRVRRPLRVPDIPGFVTLRCDFHTHTVFSDGSVWPDIRSEEAWREGFDAIAITDHIEYQPHASDLPTNHDRPFEIAAPPGERLGLVVIRGSEITRKMPPGHFNAIFLKTSKPLETPEWRDALAAARAQGAFLFWNHPGWRGHQKDGVARWYPEHTEVLEAGLMDGIEVANDREYYPEAHRWALEKNLAILANSDLHDPSNLAWHIHEGDRRPVTLVFARERSAEGIREALFARRSAAWADGKLAGREEELRPLIAAAVTVENPKLAVRAGDEGYVRFRNDSDLRLDLEGAGTSGDVVVPGKLVVAANGTSLLPVRVPNETTPGPRRLELVYAVSNVRATPEAGLSFPVAVDLEVLPPASE
ncbi:MAG: PHP domain-containing protein [Thermoanaerobaculia bacterium]